MSTYTRTNAWTEARVRHVMERVFEDLLNHVYAGVLEVNRDYVQKLREDLIYALNKQAISQFQIQYLRPDNRTQGVAYRVEDSGVPYNDDPSGGLDFCNLPRGTRLSVVLSYRQDCPHLAEVRQAMRERGWSSGGTLLEGGRHDKTYSREGYSLHRSLLGDWDDD